MREIVSSQLFSVQCELLFPTIFEVLRPMPVRGAKNASQRWPSGSRPEDYLSAAKLALGGVCEEVEDLQQTNPREFCVGRAISTRIWHMDYPGYEDYQPTHDELHKYTWWPDSCRAYVWSMLKEPGGYLELINRDKEEEE